MQGLEILRRIRRLEIRTSKLVEDIFSGEYESVFKGRGMEFSEVREYLPGDDVRLIDWNVTARFGRPFIKKFVEERELTVLLIVDLSGSEMFGSVTSTKSEMASEVAAVIAFSALRNNDKVGLIIFTDRVEKYVPPKKGRRHTLRIIREILFYRPEGKGTDLERVLRFLNDVTKRHAVVFLISDFQAEGFEKMLRISGNKHDLIAVTITDPREKELPDIGLIEVEDPETGSRLLIDTGDGRFRADFQRMAEERLGKLQRTFASMNLDHIELATDHSFIRHLMAFFRERKRRFR